ncbi:ABC transporter permease [Streptomyces noursei]|uniref:ABC transporter permease n=1 Tax=Streptomyces noursei TaxID=1971 RepID=UPI0037FA2783
MTSPQQPQPQPQPGAPGTGAQPMPPSAPESATPPPSAPVPAPGPAPTAGPMPPASPELSTPFEQGGPPSPAAEEPGTMLLQAQAQPQPAPVKEAGTMMLQAQPPAGGHPEPRPLAAHGPGAQGKEGGTMMLTVPAPPQAQPQLPQQPPQAPQAPQAPAPQPPQQQPVGANWQAGNVGYVSPIPVRPTHLGHALAAEWTKIRSVRSTIWTLGVMLVLIVGIGLLTTLALGSERKMDPLLAVGFVGVLLGSLCVITLGVLSISSEYGTGLIRTTLTACPSRARMLTAKAIVFFGLALVITTLATTVVALLDFAMLNGPAPSADAWLRSTVGAGLYVALLGLLALSVGALLRHSAGAISAMMGLVLLPMLLALFLQGESLRSLQKGMIEYSVPNAIATLYGIPFMPDGPSGWTPLLVLAGVTAVALGGAYAALTQRDV